MSTKLLGVLVLSCTGPLFVGCGSSRTLGGGGDASVDGSGGYESTGGSSGGATDPGCAKLTTEAACMENELCAPVFGRKQKVGGSLLDPPEPGTRTFQWCRYGGPGDNPIYCHAQPSCTFNPNGGTECWIFDDSCIPDGWVRLNCGNDSCPVGAEGAGGAGGASP